MELFGQSRGWFSAAKNSTVLPHCPRKIKYLQNFLEISNKKTSFSTIEGKLYLIIIEGYISHPAVKHTCKGQYNYWEVMLGFY